MTRKFRSILLTSLFVFGLSIALQAQDKYEFATVQQWGHVVLRISIQGKAFENILLGKEIKDTNDRTKLYEYVSKMQNEGWEVYNTIIDNASNMTFVFRRKK